MPRCTHHSVGVGTISSVCCQQRRNRTSPLSSRLPCSGNATNQQWRSGGGGRGLSNASKAEAALPAYYRSGARPRACSMVPFAAKPFTEMSSPLQTALQRELQLDVASSGQLLPQNQPVCAQLQQLLIAASCRRHMTSVTHHASLHTSSI